MTKRAVMRYRDAVVEAVDSTIKKPFACEMDLVRAVAERIRELAGKESALCTMVKRRRACSMAACADSSAHAAGAHARARRNVDPKAPTATESTTRRSSGTTPMCTASASRSSSTGASPSAERRAACEPTARQTQRARS